MLLLLWSACPEDTTPASVADAGLDISRPAPPADDGIYGYAHGCYAVEAFDGTGAPTYLQATADGAGFAFTAASSDQAGRFHMRAADLGTYLFYDTDRAYFVAQVVPGSDPLSYAFERPTRLQTATELLSDSFQSPAEWTLEVSARDAERYQLKHFASGRYLTTSGLTANQDEAAIITLWPQEGCVDYPELAVDAVGQVEPRTWPDGDVYGIAEIHSHLVTNVAFGGGGLYHGAPFHRLGVEYALPDCDTQQHGVEGRRDIVSFFTTGGVGLEVDAVIPIASTGETGEFNHHTEGYPTFTDWPNARTQPTHQTMYYRWLERAYLAGLRFMVQLGTSNSVLCELVLATGAQQVRYSCNDMVNIDRGFEAVRAMERYIDAQSGGPGQGWFRIVESPADARAVINEGKLAVVLGIEVSNVFDCYSVDKPGFASCTPDSVRETLDRYHELGVRVLFPVHKYDNAFSAGDGSPGIIELGNVINSGHYSSFDEDCPGPNTTFDGGDVTFGGLNKPRDDYFAPPPLDFTNFVDDLLPTLLPLLGDIQQPSLPGNWCQRHGLTPLGETLIEELMNRGWIVDIAHLPQRAMGRAYELLEAGQYPATKTHGGTNGGRLYNYGGLRGSNPGRCSDPNQPGGMVSGFLSDVDERVAKGGYPAEALAFDLNGFAGGPGPRFGDDSGCPQPQENPVTYPFTSHDGNVTFDPPTLGDRAVDFNTEGMIHIGLLPELIEDLRRDGATDAMLEPLFRSAEAYLRMWEQAEQRATERAL